MRVCDGNGLRVISVNVQERCRVIQLVQNRVHVHIRRVRSSEVGLDASPELMHTAVTGQWRR